MVSVKDFLKVGKFCEIIYSHGKEGNLIDSRLVYTLRLECEIVLSAFYSIEPFSFHHLIRMNFDPLTFISMKIDGHTKSAI